MNNNPIGVFDSGIGGLSVLNQIIKLLPNEKYIYYADTDNVPYGLKTKEQILEYVENNNNLEAFITLIEESTYDAFEVAALPKNAKVEIEAIAVKR